MIVINPGTYRDPSTETFFADNMKQQGVSMNQATLYPLTVNNSFGYNHVGAGTVFTYFSPVSDDPLASAPDENYKYFFFGTLSLSIRPSAWISGTTRFSVWLGSPSMPSGNYREFEFYQTDVLAAPSTEINLNNLYTWNGIGFSYIKIQSQQIVAAADATLTVEQLFSGVKIAW
ncbi:MAG TPA: hypothetical protein VFU05_13590 [Cyclobacteriaceae bacterium]|nr:hypothetical protein [Cyclobacteriaceae bacterium]